MILDYIIGALGFVAAALIFYFIYRLERNGTWNELVNTKSKRLVLGIISTTLLLIGLLSGLLVSSGYSYSLLFIITPAAIGTGVYFLMVSLFQKEARV